MVKRKRQQASAAEAPTVAQAAQNKKAKAAPETTSKKNTKTSTPSTVNPETIQVVVGSYDQVLHGITASFHDSSACQFADTFLFNAHSSAVRCVAVSPISAKIPGQTQKVFLATGSTDEQIHVYNLSAHPPPQQDKKSREILAKVGARPVLQNAKNREVGTLLHHASTITSLCFPTRGKLLSASEDSTIAVTRSRDWSMLTTVKAPIPKAFGRPSGDTAPFGGTPSGVNDFAIHPSMKLMISVSKGERCMRLWNLVTGKKAGVLSFTRDMLVQAGEGKHSSGEGRRVIWGSVEGADEFAVSFEKDVIVFGMDSVPKCRIMPLRTKIHQITYFDVANGSEEEEGGHTDSLMAVSTEDGRVLFFSTKTEDLVKQDGEEGEPEKLPLAKLIAQVGGKEAGVTTRIKDFAVLRSGLNAGMLYVAAASSDGKVRVWTVTDEQLGAGTGKEVGKLSGVYETHNRITCLTAYVMVPRPDDAEDSEEEVDEDDEDDEDSGDSDSESESD